MTKEKTIFINSVEIIKWNIDKHYLKFLQKKGINIAPTTFIEKNDCKSLSKLFLKSKWEKAVLKPAISGAARNTYCITKQNYTELEDIFNKLITKESMLLQEYLSDITLNGEISLIMIGGEYTHAVRKTAKKGDFRVQDDHGGKVNKYNAKESEIKFANKCLEACPYKTTYARVDIIYDNNNEPSLSELELIEPELWFRNNKNSAKLLANKIKLLVETN
jgi:glutathione synthase/RimK-type ligase-like ATP-grasp enzyme